MSIPRRLSPLPSLELPGGIRLTVASTRRSRLLGLAGLRALGRHHALLLPRCKSVHTFGMRFPLDLVWIDGADHVVRQDSGVKPGTALPLRPLGREASCGEGVHVAAAPTASSGRRRLRLADGVLAGRHTRATRAPGMLDARLVADGPHVADAFDIASGVGS